MEQAAEEFDHLEDYIDEADLDAYPRGMPEIPLDSDKGGWATKITAKAAHPKSKWLENRTVILKDNILFAGVRMTLGTNIIKDYVPTIDATVSTRVMDAGATIVGKAACENLSYAIASFSSATGPVSNPYADEYSTGGSSSGCGRLIGKGVVDMGIGGDQGGSIRAPSAWCGIVGLKPTFGLVPYTGIVSLEV